ncbi:hypothetical protein NC653_032138 [Populus alba x Populus x berolinensis]|uniref:Secreted protein n=1 Tax=Populus alba x Populus x berolinensis TaxID=444605 RepID=A0AAD6LR50_9ROSI|nr:hypothetical protein NC653_032138 [Populus alba x Populus x berolinensis]
MGAASMVTRLITVLEMCLCHCEDPCGRFIKQQFSWAAGVWGDGGRCSGADRNFETLAFEERR